MRKINLEPSWHEILNEEFQKEYFISLTNTIRKEKETGKSIYPPGGLIFNAFSKTPFQDVKIVILGQDPYHQPNQAMGLSFSVPKSVSIPPSLRNIYKELERDLKITPALHGDLNEWAEQGVLLLNAILTVEANQASSHKSLGWENFTNTVISKISLEKKNIVFMLWGNFAKGKSHLIDSTKHLILEAVHPSPLAGGKFIGCGHFRMANQYLIDNGLRTIDWQIS